MKLHQLTALALTASFLGACATQMAIPHQMTSEWSDAEIAWFNEDGTATLNGSALLRTRGGEVRTCAGYPVELVPRSAYATERVQAIYGTTTSGLNQYSVLNTIRTMEFEPDVPAYHAATKSAVCDAQGSFSFKNLPAGAYYVFTNVSWDVPGQYGSEKQGGQLFQSVELADGETKDIVITQN